MDASPKRRALAALDPNASSPRPRLGLKPGHVQLASPLKPFALPRASPEPEPKKRAVVMEDERPDHPAKKVCVAAPDEGSTQLSPGPSSQNTAEESTRQASPAASSIFDSSLLDTSQATTLTEPDAEPTLPATTAAATAPVSTVRTVSIFPSHPRMTREQAREKAEILRLRLGLASYKLKTGQTDVPLDQLQMRPLPGLRRTPSFTVRSSSDLTSPARRPVPTPRLNGEQGARGSCEPRQHDSGSRGTEGEEPRAGGSPVDIEIVEEPASDEAVPELPDLPRRPSLLGVNTPRRQQHLDVRMDDEKLTSSAVRGGVANAMLSLSRS